LLLGLVNSASAVDVDWTNAGADRSWCDPINWDTGTVPTGGEVAVIEPPVAGPVVDCDAQVLEVQGPVYSTGGNQVMDIVSGNFAIGTGWHWASSGSGTTTINISGSSTTTIGGSWRGVDVGTGVLNITDNSIVDVGSVWRVANGEDASAAINIGGNSVISTGDDLLFGENGDVVAAIGGNSSISISGDWRMACRNGGNATTNITDNSVIYAAKDLKAGDTSVAPGWARINMTGGTVDVDNLLLPASNSANAKLTLTAGDVQVQTNMEIGRDPGSLGIVNMYGDTVVVKGHTEIGRIGTGIVFLCGGTIETTTFSMQSGGGTGMMLICCSSGELIIAGNVVAQIQGYVLSGLISCAGGICCVDVVWDPILNKTTVTCGKWTGCCWDSCECPCQPRGDCNCDGRVNLADLYCLTDYFGATYPWTNPLTDPECCADFNHDNAVNLADKAILLLNWGLICPITPSSGTQTCAGCP
jgi:hypothetical protein